ncbi:heparin lyase I family protein [Kosakonia oryziphila]|uniref:heparin lyase I family protein n=1 Tax=Kosakonia oryziphila TaxID=1005667 RepID=UPI000B7CD81D
MRLNESPYSSYESWDEGQIYDISWSSKLPESNNVAEFGDYVIFQWKSRPPHTQNYPFLFRVLGNRIDLIHSNYEGKWIVIWSGYFEFENWFDIHIRILLSRDKDTGKLQLTYNGDIQTFSKDQYNQNSQGVTEFTGRTLDDSTNYFKWGVYNRGMPKHALKHYLDRLFIKQIR